MGVVVRRVRVRDRIGAVLPRSFYPDGRRGLDGVARAVYEDEVAHRPHELGGGRGAQLYQESDGRHGWDLHRHVVDVVHRRQADLQSIDRQDFVGPLLWCPVVRVEGQHTRNRLLVLLMAHRNHRQPVRWRLQSARFIFELLLQGLQLRLLHPRPSMFDLPIVIALQHHQHSDQRRPARQRRRWPRHVNRGLVGRRRRLAPPLAFPRAIRHTVPNVGVGFTEASHPIHVPAVPTC
mmetsp:Transcript_18175/g.47975  ORF Transcript_18175/g.47975 Transcript_18175/m.47975 type:complete len:235 (+) Transcript_18175:485-1189(+)